MITIPTSITLADGNSLPQRICSCLFLGLLLVFFPLASIAQVTQKGLTLEYNRHQKKTIYKRPVQLTFDGAPTVSNQTADSKGSFSLRFLEAKAGDRMPHFEIRIGDAKYVLFNKEIISKWNLSPKENLEVVLCRKDLIDYLEMTYTRNQMRHLNDKYQRTLAQLERSSKDLDKAAADREAIRQQIERLNSQHRQELEYIKARAVLFAYVDEERLDSLELKRRQCILNNDINGAVETGERMNLNQVSADAISNLKIGYDNYARQRNELLSLSAIVEDHIQNCITMNYEDEQLVGYYDTLSEIYKNLLPHYEDSKSEEQTYLTLRKKYGNLLYKRAKLYADHCYDEEQPIFQRYNADSLYLQAAEMDNSNALYDIINYRHDMIDDIACREYAQRLLSNVTEKGLDLPDDVNDADELRELEESFPDFAAETDQCFLMCRDIGNGGVSVVDFVKKDSTLMKITIPPTVSHGDKRYVVRKIGAGAFSTDSYFTMTGESKVDSLYCRKYHIDPELTKYIPSAFRLLKQIILPNTVEYVGTAAFYQRFNDSLRVNFPKNLRVIKNMAFSGVLYKDYIIKLPDGLIELGDAWGRDYVELYFDIPASVEKLRTFSHIEKFSPYVGNINLNGNPHFIKINDIIYTADSSQVYLGSIYRDDTIDILKTKKQVLYIPPQLKTDIAEIISLSYVPWQTKNLVDSIYAHPEHPRYATLDGVLYDKTMTTMIWKPYTITDFSLPPTLKELDEDSFKDSFIHSINIPDDMNPEMVATLMDLLPSAKIHYLGLTRDSCAQDETFAFIDTLMASHPENGKLPFIKGLMALKNENYRMAFDMTEKMDWPDPAMKEMFLDSLALLAHEMDSLKNRLYPDSIIPVDLDRLVVFHQNMMDGNSRDDQRLLMKMVDINRQCAWNNTAYSSYLEWTKKGLDLALEYQMADLLPDLTEQLGIAYFLNDDFQAAFNVCESIGKLQFDGSRLKQMLTNKQEKIQELIRQLHEKELDNDQCKELETYFYNMEWYRTDRQKDDFTRLRFCQARLYAVYGYYSSSFNRLWNALEFAGTAQQHPEYASMIYDIISMAFKDENGKSEAKEEIDQYLKDDPDDLRPYELEGFILAAAKEIKGAERILKKIRRADAAYAENCHLNGLLKQLSTRQK